MNEENRALDELRVILEEVKGWLHFAEGKHGALVAVNLVLIFKCTDFFINLNENQINGNKVFLLIIMGLFVLSTMISFISFIPNLGKIDELDTCICCTEGTNKILNFYGDIGTYSNSKLYLAHFYIKYYNEAKKNDFPKVEQDYAKEIIINSKITCYKFKLFKVIIYIEIIALTLLFVFWILSVFK